MPTWFVGQYAAFCVRCAKTHAGLAWALVSRKLSFVDGFLKLEAAVYGYTCSALCFLQSSAMSFASESERGLTPITIPPLLIPAS